MKHPKPTIVELLAELGIPRNEAIHDIVDRIEAAYEEANEGEAEAGSGEGNNRPEPEATGVDHPPAEAEPSEGWMP